MINRISFPGVCSLHILQNFGSNDYPEPFPKTLNLSGNLIAVVREKDTKIHKSLLEKGFKLTFLYQSYSGWVHVFVKGNDIELCGKDHPMNKEEKTTVTKPRITNPHRKKVALRRNHLGQFVKGTKTRERIAASV